MKISLNDRKFMRNKFVRVGYDVSTDMYTFIEEIWYSKLGKHTYVNIINLYDDIYTAVVYHLLENVIVVTRDYRLINVIPTIECNGLEDTLRKCCEHLLVIDDEGATFVEGGK